MQAGDGREQSQSLQRQRNSVRASRAHDARKVGRAWPGGFCIGDPLPGQGGRCAHSPAGNSERKLARSHLAASQSPQGAWTRRELIILVGGTDADGNAWPARLARAAAYNPATDSWRRSHRRPLPASARTSSYDGREVLVVGSVSAPRGNRPGPLPTVGFAYNPCDEPLAATSLNGVGPHGAAAVWTGKRLLVLGGGWPSPART